MNSSESSGADFRLTGEQRQLREAVRKFVEAEIRPVATEHDVERLYRDAKIAQIYEGTTETRKNVVARELLDEGF